MNVSIEIGTEFKRQFKRLAKKYHSLIDDFESWKNEILKNPLVGDDLGSGVRKVRMSIESKGKGMCITFFIQNTNCHELSTNYVTN